MDIASGSSTRSRRALRPHRELLIAWTLLLLDEGDVYGYQLHHDLRARGLGLLRSTLYRSLHQFELDRWVSSKWSAPIDGPRRHVYSLTSEGRAELREISALIAATRDTYSTFLDAHRHAVAQRIDPAAATDEEAMPVPRDPGDQPARAAAPATATASRPQPLRPHRELLVGWMLLHLDGGPTYGYDLRREFHAHQLAPDPSAIYRMLRRLEADSWVQSRWLSPAAGPRRRFYRLTTRGRRNLDEIAALIGAIRDSHDAYLQAYGDAHPPPA